MPLAWALSSWPLQSTVTCRPLLNPVQHLPGGHIDQAKGIPTNADSLAQAALLSCMAGTARSQNAALSLRFCAPAKNMERPPLRCLGAFLPLDVLPALLRSLLELLPGVAMLAMEAPPVTGVLGARLGACKQQ